MGKSVGKPRRRVRYPPECQGPTMGKSVGKPRPPDSHARRCRSPIGAKRPAIEAFVEGVVHPHTNSAHVVSSAHVVAPRQEPDDECHEAPSFFREGPADSRNLAGVLGCWDAGCANAGSGEGNVIGIIFVVISNG